jgi:transcriptional regulator with XRE-family HTH domain
MPGMTGAPMSDLHTQCSSCGDVLATDNRAGLCEPCATIAQATPDVLSADFWEQPEIRSALLSRHFGRFLRTYRTAQSPQVKQTQLAHWLGITQGQLSRIERSTTPLHDLHKLDTWARALHVPDDRLWFSPSPTPTSSGVDAVAPDRATVEKSLHNAHNEGSDVRRRDLLKVAGVTAAAAGSAGLLANPPWQRLMDSVDKGRPVDAATAQLMHDRTADFFDTEETVPARQILESLTQHRATLVALLPNARTDAVRNQLAVSLGETDALAGWLHFDLGCANEAANAWRSTLIVAKETGDGALAACALGYWSYLAAFRNDVAPAVRLLQQAQEYVPGSSAPATRSWISARQAEELGRLGDETGALRALERAFTAFDFARPRTERNWTPFFTTNRLGGLTVSTYMALNHPDATAVADSLLASLPPTDNKARAYALADLTTLAVQNKDYDRANSLVGDAIDVTIRTENSIARQRLLTLASALTTTTDRNTTGALRDQIISSLRR